MVGIKHEIHFGDSREVLKDIEEESIDFVISSPPYHVGKSYGEEYDDEGDYNEYLDMIYDVFGGCYKVLKPHSYIAINVGRESGRNTGAHMAELLEDSGFEYQNLIIWNKGVAAANPTFTEQYKFARFYEPYLQTERILIYSKGPINEYRGERKEENKIPDKMLKKYRGNIWKIQPKTNSDHPAPFPLELPRVLITFYSRKNETILDPWLGSGTSMKAAAQLDRSSIGIELEEKYLPLIKQKIGFSQQKLGSEKIDYDIIHH